MFQGFLPSSLIFCFDHHYLYVMKSSLLVVLALLVSSAESFANTFGVPRYRTAAQSSLTKCPDDGE